MSALLKIGTRGSRLALWQAEWVKGQLARHGVETEVVIIKTQGDAEVDRPLRADDPQPSAVEADRLRAGRDVGHRRPGPVRERGLTARSTFAVPF